MSRHVAVSAETRVLTPYPVAAKQATCLDTSPDRDAMGSSPSYLFLTTLLCATNPFTVGFTQGMP